MAKRRGGSISKSSPSYIRRQGDANKAFNEIQKRIQAALDNIVGASEEGLDKVAEMVFEGSQKNAPKDTGDLRDSAYIASDFTKEGYTVEIGYKADHAVYTHEIGPYGDPTTPGTDFKYLERALTDIESEIEGIVAGEIKKELK